MKLKILSKREESIAEKIVDAAFTVHKVLGSSLLEILLKQMNFEKIFILTQIWHIKCSDRRWFHLWSFCWVSLIAQKRLASR
jgi:hypothetical protein